MKVTNYTQKRYKIYGLISLIIFILPFIKINDNHLFLLSFDHKKLNLFFVSFDNQELYLMPFLLIFFFLSIFFITTLAGRIWCAWSCPQTIFRVIYRDLIQTKILKIRQNIQNKQKIYEGEYIKKITAIVIFYIISLVAVSNLLWYFIPPEDFFNYIKNPKEHLLMLGILFFTSLFLTFDIVFLKEKFCIYVCPYARIQSVMFDKDTKQVIYDEKRGGIIFKEHKKISDKPDQGECVGCLACVRVCPTHIDIRAGMQLECINCLECADACSKIQSKFNRKSLINWTSLNSIENKEKIKYLRFRTIAYILALSIVFIALIFMSTKKENMLLNINRTSELYNIKKIHNEISVLNYYVFLFQNTDNKDHIYYFDINLKNDKDAIKIISPSKPFKLKAGEKNKVIVTLKAQKNLSDDNQKDITLPITIKAYAIDDKNIMVTRKSVFVYPKESILQEYAK